MEKCFSNLLAVGFDRFEIDVYWDVSRHIWSLCPVELGDVASSANASSASLASDDDGLGSPRGRSIRVRQDTSTLAVPSGTSQQTASSSSGTSISTTATVSSASATGPATPDIPSTENGTLIQVGPYSCTSTCTLFPLTRVLNGHLHSTQNNLNATLKLMMLNLHVATLASNPTGSAKRPSEADLPNGHTLLSNVLSAAVTDYLYTPKALQTERSHLNGSSSWYGSVSRFQPDSSYFQVQGSGVHFSTPDGWPSESFIEMEFAKRMLAGYGRVDPQLENYNFSADASTIFAAGYLKSNRTTTINSKGFVGTGCFYRPDVYSLSNVNNSWATSADLVSAADGAAQLQPVFAEASNLTYCGISPVLNQTLKNVTADVDFNPYKNYIQSTIWSWAPHEPLNASLKDDDRPRTNHRCAVLSAASGHWETNDCGQSHYSACRAGGPYTWAIGNSEATYADAQLPCPDGTDFDVPRTALENTYLLHKWRQTADTRGTKDQLLWVNFNDIGMFHRYSASTPC